LEFSLATLFELRSSVFILGGLQVIISIALTTAVGLYLGMNFVQSFVIGGIVAMSSTAIVTKQLGAQRELHTQEGHNAVGILLFQDLTVIPFFIIIGSVTAVSGESIALTLGWAFIKGLIALGIIFVIARYILRPVFKLIDNTHSLELFTLTVLLVTLGAAWFSSQMGLSAALGGFFAGIMLSETEFKQRIANEIRPFRDVLLGLFFITVGMLLNLSSWRETWPWILLLFTALFFFKIALVYALNRLLKYDSTTSLRTGIILAQGGEFGFAILILALNRNLLPADYGQVVLSALLLSIGLAPTLIRYNKTIVKKVFNYE